MVVVLRAGSVDALWPGAAHGAGQGAGTQAEHHAPGTQGKQAAQRAQGALGAQAARGEHALGWRGLASPVVCADAGTTAAADATTEAPAAPAGAALRDAVVAAFAALKAGLGAASQESGAAPVSQLVVLLAGPAVAVLTVPWSDALLRPAAAQRHARAELLARGCAVLAEDSVQIDARPSRGQPRAVFWVPAWLQREVQALASALKVRRCEVQALNLAAAAWLVHQSSDGRVWGLLGSGTLQLWSATDASAAGEALADTPAAASPPERLQALWQRAGLRSPVLAAARLRVLSLDEPPPPSSAGPAATAGATAGATAEPSWLPWPVLAGVAGRAALDLQLLRSAQARPVLPLVLVPTPSVLVSGAEGRTLWWAATFVVLAASAALSWRTVQHEAALQRALAAPVEKAPLRAPSATAAERAELRAVNAAVQQLNLPLPQLLRTLQPPRDIAVRLHALDLAPRGAENAGTGAAGAAGAVGATAAAAAGLAADPSARTLLKLSAEAPRSRDMTRYVDFLAGRPGMGAVQLVRHEVDGSSAGDAVYRFELELEWPR